MGIKSLHKQTQNFPQILNQIHSIEVRVFHLKITTENFSFHEKKKTKMYTQNDKDLLFEVRTKKIYLGLAG